MKILLVYPPVTLSERDYMVYSLPLGLAYIASVLRENNYDVKCLDAFVGHGNNPIHIQTEAGELFHYGLELKEIKRRIKKVDPDVVGISCPFTMMEKNVTAISKSIKDIDPEIKVVVGGAHPSALPESVLSNNNIDFVVIGEGEKTFLELLDFFKKGNKHLKEIKGIGFRENGKIVITPQRELIDDLDKIPFPARDLFPIEEYIKAARARKTRGFKRDRHASVITSRGCPGNCIFCSIHSVWGHRWRARSPTNVVNEIEELVNKYRIGEIHFEDDNLTLDKKRMTKICDLIIERGLDIAWSTPNGVRIADIDKEILRKMKKSGCYQLCFGIESGNEYIRNKVIKKPINYEHAKEVIKECKKLGIWTHGFFIIGLPGENLKTMHATFECAKNLDLDNADFFIATPYPKTRLYEIALQKGYLDINEDSENFRVSAAVLNTEYFDSHDLLKLQRKFYKDFVFYRLRKEVISLYILRRLIKIRRFEDVRLLWRRGLGVWRFL